MTQEEINNRTVQIQILMLEYRRVYEALINMEVEIYDVWLYDTKLDLYTKAVDNAGVEYKYVN